jgi:hypothetical protein
VWFFKNPVLQGDDLVLLQKRFVQCGFKEGEAPTTIGYAQQVTFQGLFVHPSPDDRGNELPLDARYLLAE